MFGINQKDLLFRDMRKLVIFLVIVLGALQYCFSQQAYIWICQGDSYTWHFDVSPTSEVVIRAIKNYGFGPDATTYDTIHENHITLSPQTHTIYNIMSINGNSNICTESLEIDVLSPSATVDINNNILSISNTTTGSTDGYPMYIHVTNSDNALVYHYMINPNDSIDINNIPPGNYNVYLSTSEITCRTKIPITVP